jgi:uncharacterized membrane protein YdjX (TVP38/TMEM64 family)
LIESPAPSPVTSPLRRWLPLLALVVVAAIVFATGAHRYLSIEAIATNKHKLEALVTRNFPLALATYMVTYVAIIALSIPGSLLMTILGGLLFPFWICAPAVVISAGTGAIILFIVARSSLGEALRAKSGPGIARMTEGLRADAASYMLFLRLVPLFPFALVNLAPAIVGIPLKTFVWTTFLGIMPASFAFAFAATSLDSVLDERLAAFEACKTAGRPDCSFAIDLSMLVSPKLLLAFAALGVLALIPVVAKRAFAHRKGAPFG